MANQNERPTYPYTASNGVVVTIQMARKPVNELSPAETTAVLEASRVCGKAKRPTEKVGKVNVAIGDAGGLCFYGFGQYPINAYVEAVESILDSEKELRDWIAKNNGKLKRKAPKA